MLLQDRLDASLVRPRPLSGGNASRKVRVKKVIRIYVPTHQHTNTQASSNVYKTLDVRLARYFRIQIPGKRRGGVRKRRKGGRYLIGIWNRTVRVEENKRQKTKRQVSEEQAREALKRAWLEHLLQAPTNLRHRGNPGGNISNRQTRLMQ